MTTRDDLKSAGAQILEAIELKLELPHIDFKEALTEDQERIKEHINAFGNLDCGGFFVFGITNTFSATAKQLDCGKIAERMTNLAHDTQAPPLNCTTFTIKTKLGDKLVVHVKSGSRRPVFIRGRDPWGGIAAFKRSGSSTLPMSQDEIRDLMVRSERTFKDEETAAPFEPEDLDFSLLKRTFPAMIGDHADEPHNLAILIDRKVVRSSLGRNDLTLAGALVFASSSDKFRSFRNIRIEFQQFRGVNRDEPIVKKDFAGNLPTQIAEATEFLMQRQWMVPRIDGVRRQDVPSFDKEAIREVIVNAVMHRDYSQLHTPVKIALFSDRVEIENPGGLMPGLTTLNMIHRREWRNPTLASLMESAGLAEIDGQGIDRILSITRRLRVPAPVFTDFGGLFRVTFAALKKWVEFTHEEKVMSIMAIVMTDGLVSNETLRTAYSLSLQQASSILKALVSGGYLEPSGSSRKLASYHLSAKLRKEVY